MPAPCWELDFSPSCSRPPDGVSLPASLSGCAEALGPHWGAWDLNAARLMMWFLFQPVRRPVPFPHNALYSPKVTARFCLYAAFLSPSLPIPPPSAWALGLQDAQPLLVSLFPHWPWESHCRRLVSPVAHRRGLLSLPRWMFRGLLPHIALHQTLPELLLLPVPAPPVWPSTMAG